MFVGTIPADMQKIVREITAQFTSSDIYIGTSGNFTIERVISDQGFNLHSNDVTLYSSVIGWYLSGEEIKFTFNEDYDEDYGFLKEYIQDEAGKVATILLATRLMETVGKLDKSYYKRMHQAYIDQFPTIHGKTKERIENLETRLKSYSASDVFTWVDSIPAEQSVVCYPPFFGESGDYEKYFEKLEDLFQWTPPTYDFIYGERLTEFFEKLMTKKHFVFGTKDKLEGEQFAPYLKAMTKTTNRGVPIYVYTNANVRRIVQPKQKLAVLNTPHLKPDQDIGDNISLLQLELGQFYQLRSQYMNHNIKPGRPTMTYAVLVDGYITGCIGFSGDEPIMPFDKYVKAPQIYMLSDFAVANSKYKKLSKLMLYAAMSKEVQLQMEHIKAKRIRSLITTAFSNNPISMKYRGVFRLLKRDEADDGHNKYKLQYGAEMGQWTLKEGFEIWKKKHGQAKK